jgi:hypothetical protein
LFSPSVGAGREIQRFGNFDNFVSIFVKYANVQESSSAGDVRLQERSNASLISIERDKAVAREEEGDGTASV